MTEDLLRWPPGHRFGRDSSVTWAPMGQEPFHLSSRRREFSGNRLPGRRLRARVRKDLQINDLLAPAINKNDENTAAGLQTWWPRCQQRRYLTSRVFSCCQGPGAAAGHLEAGVMAGQEGLPRRGTSPGAWLSGQIG